MAAGWHLKAGRGHVGRYPGVITNALRYIVMAAHCKGPVLIGLLPTSAGFGRSICLLSLYIRFTGVAA